MSEDGQSDKPQAPLFRVPTDVKLSDEDQQKYTDFINEKAVSPNDACPVCQSPNNSVLVTPYRLETLKDPPAFGGSFMPIVATVCWNCGFTRLFNRLVLDGAVQVTPAEDVVTDGR